MNEQLKNRLYPFIHSSVHSDVLVTPKDTNLGKTLS